MKSIKQLEYWEKGIPIHNKEKNECCPDFSCCEPTLLAPEHERKAFVKAFKKGDTATMHIMLIKFLGRAISSPQVYVAGYREDKGTKNAN